VGNNEKRVFVLRFESYNIFNHSEFSGLGTSATYNASFVNTNTPSARPPARVQRVSVPACFASSSDMR
jgi:hypothetical protein